MNDNTVSVAIEEAAADSARGGHDPARRIVKRQHFKKLYQPTRADYRVNLEAGQAIGAAAKEAFGDEAVRHSFYPAKGGAVDFPVLVDDAVEAASSLLEVVTKVLPTKFDAVYVSPERHEEAKRWLAERKDAELEARRGEDSDEET